MHVIFEFPAASVELSPISSATVERGAAVGGVRQMGQGFPLDTICPEYTFHKIHFISFEFIPMYVWLQK